jgi:hypothetical protein
VEPIAVPQHQYPAAPEESTSAKIFVIDAM